MRAWIVPFCSFVHCRTFSCASVAGINCFHTLLMRLKQILSWLVNLRHCNSTASVNMKESDVVILRTFCSMSVEQWYSFSLLMARHLNMEKVIYRVRLNSVFCQKKNNMLCFPLNLMLFFACIL